MEEQDLADRKAIRAVISGNHNAFRSVVERYQPIVTALGRRLVRSSADVPDFVQDVFLKAFTHIRQYSGKGRFYSWLMRIAYTTAINRRNRKEPEDALDPEAIDYAVRASAEGDPERCTLQSAMVEALREAIAGLPQHLARAVELSYFARLRYSDIAELTGVSLNTLKSHVHRARKLLRERLGSTVAADCSDLENV
ncbi:MAG: sigma-70 family RNA polymerase sigma factor [Spirochaetia bacterium]